MASSVLVSVNDSTPTLVFSGTGNVVIRAASGTMYYGGSNVSASNGLTVLALQMNLNSPDEIYAISASGTHNVQVFSAR